MTTTIYSFADKIEKKKFDTYTMCVKYLRANMMSVWHHGAYDKIYLNNGIVAYTYPKEHKVIFIHDTGMKEYRFPA